MDAIEFDDLPRIQFPTELMLRAQDVRLLLLDVDGVLTPGDLLVGADGEQVKRFSTLDGYGLKQLAASGVCPVIISGRDSPGLRQRLGELGLLRDSTLGCDDKLAAANAVIERHRLDWSRVAVAGDDWPDLPLLARAALAACPPQSHPEVLARVHWVTRTAAGRGAVRELCDLLLLAQGSYRTLLQAALRGH